MPGAVVSLRQLAPNYVGMFRKLKPSADCGLTLRSIDTTELRDRFAQLLEDGVSREITIEALQSLKLHFPEGPNAPGLLMAGRAESGLGDPQQVALSTAFLAEDLLQGLAEIGFSKGSPDRGSSEPGRFRSPSPAPYARTNCGPAGRINRVCMFCAGTPARSTSCLPGQDLADGCYAESRRIIDTPIDDAASARLHRAGGRSHFLFPVGMHRAHESLRHGNCGSALPAPAACWLACRGSRNAGQPATGVRPSALPSPGPAADLPPQPAPHEEPTTPW